MASCRRGEFKVWLPYPALEEEIAIRQAAWGSRGRNGKGQIRGPKSSGNVWLPAFFFSMATSYLLAARL